MEEQVLAGAYKAMKFNEGPSSQATKRSAGYNL
jgi:hypothetical protein